MQNFSISPLSWPSPFHLSLPSFHSAHMSAPGPFSPFHRPSLTPPPSPLSRSLPRGPRPSGPSSPPCPSRTLLRVRRPRARTFLGPHAKDPRPRPINSAAASPLDSLRPAPPCPHQTLVLPPPLELGAQRRMPRRCSIATSSCSTPAGDSRGGEDHAGPPFPSVSPFVCAR